MGLLAFVSDRSNGRSFDYSREIRGELLDSRSRSFLTHPDPLGSECSGTSPRSGRKSNARRVPASFAPTSTTDPRSSSLQTYIQLTQAEAAFRIQKSDLGLRPVLESTQRARRRSHLRPLPRLRAVEDAGAVATACGPWQLTPPNSRRGRTTAQRRCRSAHRRARRSRDSSALRGSTWEGRLCSSIGSGSGSPNGSVLARLARECSANLRPSVAVSR